MIKTISEFIEQLKKKGLESIKDHEDVKHPSLIGDMYEGLTQTLLNSAIPDSLDLRIVSGKIKNGKGEMTSQIDCMIVEGEGTQLPFSNNYIYHFSQVIAVVEVKKNLFSGEIDSSYANLKTVIDISAIPERDGERYIIHALRDAWKAMLRTELPKRAEVDTLPEEQQAIYHTLLMEAYFPLRIAIGYYGFKTEYSLREGFASFLESKLTSGNVKGFGIGSFPTLIICGFNTIIKNNGMPYFYPFDYKKTFYWPIYVTSNRSPIFHLLEVIWTRLSYKYEISSSIFGHDFNSEPTHLFIDCKVVKRENGQIGWGYDYHVFSEDTLNRPYDEIPEWSPVFLSPAQFNTLFVLTQKEAINFENDEHFLKMLSKYGEEPNQFIETLAKTGLIYSKDSEIRFLTDECFLFQLPDGRLAAGENKSGEFLHWLKKHSLL